MRRAAKVDDTQEAIVKALRQVGCKVLSMAAIGNGAPDLLVLVPGQGSWQEAVDALILLEVKNLDGRGAGLTPDQVKFHAQWPVVVVTSPEEALKAAGVGI